MNLYLSALHTEHANHESRLFAVPTLGPMQMISEYTRRGVASCGVISGEFSGTKYTAIPNLNPADDVTGLAALPHNRLALAHSEGTVRIYDMNTQTTDYVFKLEHNASTLPIYRMLMGARAEEAIVTHSRRTIGTNKHQYITEMWNKTERNAWLTCTSAWFDVDVNSNGQVLFTDLGNELKCYDMLGYELYCRKLEDVRQTSMKVSPVDDSIVIVGRGEIACLSSQLMCKWKVSYCDYASTVTIDAANNIIVPNQNGQITILREDGSKQFYNTSLSVSNICVLDDGRLVCNTHSGLVVLS